MVPSGFDLEFLPRQAQILNDGTDAGGRVAERLVTGAPHHGLGAIRRPLRRAEPVVVQEVQLAVAGLEGRERAVAQVDVIRLRVS